MCLIVSSVVNLTPPDSLEREVIEAVERCVVRWGWSKTTMGDIAKESGLSRATLYRMFPGGRDALIDATQRHGLLNFFHELRPHLAGGNDLHAVLAGAIAAAARYLNDDEQFQHHLANDPGQVLRMLTFDGLERVLAASRVFVGSQLLAFVDRNEANQLAEWASRVVISYTLEPNPSIDVTDPDVALALVRSRCPAPTTSALPTIH